MRIGRIAFRREFEAAIDGANKLRHKDAALGRLRAWVVQRLGDQREKLDKGKRAQILALREKGFSIRMVAARVGVSHTTVRKLAPGGRNYHTEYAERMANAPPPGGLPFPKVTDK